MRYVFLLIGVIILAIGLLFMNGYFLQNKMMIRGLLLSILGVFIISKQLGKTKELPSKKYKERMKKKEGK